MKTEYCQIHHVKTSTGWQLGSFQAKVLMHPEDAAQVNRHFGEHGIRVVPNNEYEKYLKNARY